MTVSGSSSRLVHNDTARIGINVRSDRSSARKALAATSATMRKVIGRVKAAGRIADRDIATRGISVTHVTIGPPSDRSTVFRARQSISVLIHRVRSTGRVIKAAVGAGATAVGGPRFSVSNPDALYDRALAAAFSNARRKARVLARRAGARLGPALTINEGGGVRSLPVAAPDGAGSGAGKGAPPIRAGRSRVSASVQVTFRLT